MPYPLPLTRTEAYLAYKAGVVQQSDLKPSLAVPRNGIDAWLAYWTGLAADYPKREDGTPHILQEEEVYIAYLCGVINEYPEKCLRRVGAYLRYLISARWGRPDHPLNREELYLSLIKTQFIPSGDPSSDIEIDGTAKAAFVDVKMYGDTFQQTYTGKNLLAYPYYNTTKTMSGITFTDNGDGSVTVNGTLTGNEALFWITRDIWSYNTKNIVVPAGTYTISPTGNPNVRVYVSAYGETQGLLTSVNASTASATFTVAEKASLTIRISVKPQGTAVNNLVIKPQLESGSTSTDFEPYVGGQASPNPDYPQPIQTVTGLQTVEIRGKNLIYLEPNTGSPYLNGLSASYDNKSGAIHIYGTTTDSWSNIGAITNLSLPAGTYTISATDNQQTHSKSVYAYHPDGTRTQFYIGPTEQSKTVTVSKPIVNYYIYVSQMTIGEAIDDTFYMQLEKGSTATDYEPYSSNDYEINLNCNIYNKDLAYMSGNDMLIPIDITPGSSYHYGATTRWVGAYLYDASGTLVRTVGHTSAIRSGNFTAAPNEVKAVFTFYAGPDVTWDWSGVEFYDLAGVIELCKLGDYQDYIWEDGDDWKVHKATAIYTFTGSENWGRASEIASPYYGYWIRLDTYGAVLANGENVTSKIEYFKQMNRAFGVSKPCFMIGYDSASSSHTIILGTEFETVASLKTWLANNAVHLYYALATPTDTVITDQNLIDQLNALKQGGAENGTTYIKVDATDPNLPGLLYVEAPKYE